MRIGCALVAWMILFAHFVWLAIITKIDCGPGGDEVFLFLLILAPFAMISALLISVTRPLGDIHGTLQWMAFPLGGLIVIGAFNVWSVAVNIHTTGLSPCSQAEAVTWQFAWAGVQTVTLLIVLVAIVRNWRTARLDRRDSSSN